jgi:hypothetical protein
VHCDDNDCLDEVQFVLYPQAKVPVRRELLEFLRVMNLELSQILNNNDNSVVLVRKRTIPTERPQPVGEVNANCS